MLIDNPEGRNVGLMFNRSKRDPDDEYDRINDEDFYIYPDDTSVKDFAKKLRELADWLEETSDSEDYDDVYFQGVE